MSATGDALRSASIIKADIEKARINIQAATTEHQTYQAKARAGLIKPEAIAPYLAATDIAHAKFHSLNAELNVRQDSDNAAAALASLLEKVR
ncbi:hypothetical protein PAMC26577_30625 [Caballeronia sordidicola]|uniref:Uncharacterized protein n=1 Tax=Caballeronia sordidicola TaxID=196367 RepID=A0A242MDL9_CABSO|nr:hypothetical protein PAMC26577_30625 [Caballeronia sordidicola]